MKRVFVVLLLVACGSSSQQPTQPAPLPLPSASASAEPAKKDPVAIVQGAIPHMLDLLARGDDERFIDEVVVPEELDKVLGNRPKAQLVADFKEDKHEGVVRMLERVRGAQPLRTREENGRTLVTYDGGREREVTFVVEGQRVFIKN